jgi:hypothetical protein
MPAACSHALTALTGHAVKDDLEPVLGFLEVGDVERHELGPAKRAREAQQQQRAVAEALEALGSGKGHGAGCLG